MDKRRPSKPPCTGGKLLYRIGTEYCLSDIFLYHIFIKIRERIAQHKHRLAYPTSPQHQRFFRRRHGKPCRYFHRFQFFGNGNRPMTVTVRLNDRHDFCFRRKVSSHAFHVKTYGVQVHRCVYPAVFPGFRHYALWLFRFMLHFPFLWPFPQSADHIARHQSMAPRFQRCQVTGITVQVNTRFGSFPCRHSLRQQSAGDAGQHIAHSRSRHAVVSAGVQILLPFTAGCHHGPRILRRHDTAVPVRQFLCHMQKPLLSFFHAASVEPCKFPRMGRHDNLPAVPRTFLQIPLQRLILREQINPIRIDNHRLIRFRQRPGKKLSCFLPLSDTWTNDDYVRPCQCLPHFFPVLPPEPLTRSLPFSAVRLPFRCRSVRIPLCPDPVGHKQRFRHILLENQAVFFRRHYLHHPGPRPVCAFCA